MRVREEENWEERATIRGRDGSPSETLPLALLQERKALSLCCSGRQEPFVVLLVDYLCHLLTREEVRQFHQLLLSALAALDQSLLILRDGRRRPLMRRSQFVCQAAPGET